MDLLSVLTRAVGERHVFSGADVEPRYVADQTRGLPGTPLCVVRPGSTAEVSAVLAACHAEHRAVVTLGGGTGMARGALARDGEVILSLERLRAIESVDTVGGTMTVEAGVVLETAQRAADEAGLFLAVDIGARGSCTIGGMIATNAGGNQVLNFGMMRENVLGIEAVLADGTVITSLNRMLKNNAGYDLKQLFIGSEGTLGIVTRAVLRLRSKALGRAGALLALESFARVPDLLRLLQDGARGQLTAFEVMWRGYYIAATAAADAALPIPGSHPLYVLVETSGDTDRLSALLERGFDSGIVADAVVAQSGRELDAFWRIRDAVGDITARMPVVEPFDVSVPLGDTGTFVAQVEAALMVGLPNASALFFGHLADSNLHIVVALEREQDRPRAESIVYDLVREYGGSVSAEHGIGALKTAYLAHSRSPAEIALMRTLKTALDPRGVLNPGRVLAE